MAAVNAQEATIKAVLDHTDIDGLDIADALSRLNNSAAIFMRIIRSFTLNTPTILADLANPTAENLPDYAIKVHGCKGSLYGIGAQKAGDAAKALEMASKAGDLATVQRDNDAFIALVELLLERLRGLEAEVQVATATPETVATTAAAPDRAVLTRLLQATREYDMETMSQLIDQLSAQNYASGGSDIVYFKEQFEAFAYDRIEERLEQLLRA
jgi:HPt (histidine-containing phosphotransfer) domain-containing protein